MQRAIIDDGDKTEDTGRDLVHGDGGTRTRTPEDLSHDD